MLELTEKGGSGWFVNYRLIKGSVPGDWPTAEDETLKFEDEDELFDIITNKFLDIGQAQNEKPDDESKT